MEGRNVDVPGMANQKFTLAGQAGKSSAVKMMNTEIMNTKQIVSEDRNVDAMNTEPMNTESLNTEPIDSGAVDTESVNTEQSDRGTASTTAANPLTSRATNWTQAQELENTGEAETDSAPRAMIYRHPTSKLVGGVCGGVADYFGWDPALVRIAWVVATVATSGGGFLAYLALWALLPVGTSAAGQQQPAAIELNERSLGRAAILLIGLGGLWLLANLGILPWLWGSFWGLVGIVFWPALLIGAGYLLLRQTRQGNWNFNWGKTSERLKSQVGDRMPGRGDMKSGLRSARQGFPLKRSRTDRIFMGVCGGIGQKLGIDANLVRLVWGAFSVGSVGMGVLIYVVAGLLLPEEQPAELEEINTTYYDEESQDVTIIDASV